MFRMINRIFPNFFPSIHIIIGNVYDIYKFVKTSTSINYQKRREKIEASLIRQCHGIEKGLALPNTRLGFGKDLISILISNIQIYYKKFGYNNIVQICIDVLVSYCEYHETKNNEMDAKVLEEIKKIANDISEYKEDEQNLGGIVSINKSDLISNINECNFEVFSKSRSSIRDFADGEISNEIIEKAIEIASNSPSACNRQAWKVHVFKGKKKDIVLEHQNGNQGFQERISTVLLITGLNTSYSYYERNQMFVDGGIFSMSLMYAFHYLQVGVCALNSSYSLSGEIALRKAIQLSIDEEPVVMLAIGNLKEKFEVTKSQRKDISGLIVYD